MRIGAPKEIKNHEYRVGLTPEAVKILVKNGHSVSIESGAGVGAGFPDDDFKKVGALITNNPFIWLSSDIIIKVKEPLIEEMEEYSKLMIDWPYKKHPENDLIIFAFFHFPANPLVKKFVLENKIKAIPYENIQLADGSRPILKAMSEIAAEISVDAASYYLRKENGGKGVLLKDATAIVIGCKGILGKMAFCLLAERGCHVIGFDKNEELIPFGPGLLSGSGLIERKILSPIERMKKILPFTDLVICAAAQKGEGAPKLINREMLKLMQQGSVIIDPPIDEGGCCETSRPTSHDNPVYIKEGIIHYCVVNMPGAVPHSSTPALVKESLPYILEVANKGWEKAIQENPILAQAASDATQAAKID